jgi:hypothetical protein
MNLQLITRVLATAAGVGTDVNWRVGVESSPAAGLFDVFINDAGPGDVTAFNVRDHTIELPQINTTPTVFARALITLGGTVTIGYRLYSYTVPNGDVS